MYINRYPDEEAGEIPMAYVVRKTGSNLTATQIMDYISNQARSKLYLLAFYHFSSLLICVLYLI